VNGEAPAPALRAVIADDERLARQKLRLLLDEEPAISIVAECSNGTQAVAAVRAKRPDLLFLDIRMPEMDGFGVLAQLAANEMPVVIFTTAYDEYAIKAFDADALDYLLKPFDQRRLHRAVEKARADVRKSQDHTEAARMLSDLLERSKPSEAKDGRWVIKAAGRLVFLELSEIDWIEAAANYVRLNVGGSSYLLRETIGRIAARLDPGQFARIHRSTIVNVKKLRELQTCDSGEFIAILKSGKALSCSRSYRGSLEQIIARHS